MAGFMSFSYQIPKFVINLVRDVGPVTRISDAGGGLISVASLAYPWPWECKGRMGRCVESLVPSFPEPACKYRQVFCST